MVSRRIPIATYRLQFNRRFRFPDALALMPYLHQLGISDLYASPLLKARSGSWHNYDVTDPTQLNPELGTEEEFELLIQALKQYGMGLLLDIVPNHLATGPENPWWTDLLENGWCSPYAAFFDIDWNPTGGALKGKVLLPILSNPYEQVLRNGELTLTIEDAELFIRYHDYKLPLAVKSYSMIFSPHNTPEANLDAGNSAFSRLRQLITAVERLPDCANVDMPRASQQYQERQAIKEEFRQIVATSPEIKTFLLANIAHFNGKKGEPESFKLMNRLLAQQVYQLAYWKTVRKQLNYRRFFDINDLIGIRVEAPEAFEATHALILRLIREGKLTGLRIDHIDGLYDPLGYLSQLQQHIVPQQAAEAGRRPAFYIICEKILTGDETLPEEWPVFGTTGYDFLNTVNALFVDGEGAQSLLATYSRLTGSQAAFEDIVYQKKRQVIEELFPGELHALGNHLANLARNSRYDFDYSPEELTRVLGEVIACLPVYRTYIRTLKVPLRDRPYLKHAVSEAQRRNPDLDAAAVEFLQHVLLLDFPPALTPEQREAWLGFVLRWQQLTGAIMAKGFEDTALYNYNRLVSLNEVGGNPASAGMSAEEFHQHNLARRERCPYTLNATSTHDTKRSQDVRARINVLSEVSEEWEKHLTQWRRWNEPKKQRLNGLPVPEPGIEMLLYQTLIGAWPLAEEEVPEFKARLKDYMVKAVREAKVFTSWLSPNSDYESALIKFLESILNSNKENGFLEDFLRFEKRIAHYGALNSLAQVLLKITSPGVPDFYQGMELWDFSLVDPDNRRPVDFNRRINLLDALVQQEAQGQQSLAQQILNSWQDGRVKFYLTYKALNIRRAHRELFLDGDYIPLQTLGQRAEHLCALGRQKGEGWALVIVPRLMTKLVRAGEFPLGRRVWGDDQLLLPDGAPEYWLNIFTGEKLRVSGIGKGLPISSILSIFPVALLISS